MLNGYRTEDFTLISSVPLSGFPSSENPGNETLSSLEFAGDILYGSTAVHVGTPTSGSALARIDIATGKLSLIGFSGIPAWTTGMAYDPTEGVMYGITGGFSPSQLFKINLATGKASNAKPITYEGEQIYAATGLTLGEDGNFYAVLQTDPGDTPDDTHLFLIDLTTGAITDLGDTGIDPIAVSRATKELSPGNPSTGPMSASVDDVRALARLYSAAFDRLPKVPGLNYWVNTFESGKSIQDIAKKFYESPEFVKKYGTLDNRQFVEQLYRNVLGREGAPGGIDYWESHLDNNVPRERVLAQFADSIENKSKTEKLFSDTRFEGGLWVF
jgi:hypothetical protein